MDLSVILVNWNTREELSACLGSLRQAMAEGFAADIEVVVVDNASADLSAEMVRSEFPEVRLFANSENLNYSAGSNQAIRAARGQYLLLLNPDTQVTANTLAGLLHFVQERPRAAAVAPRLVSPDGTAQQSVRGFPEPIALLGELTALARLFPTSRLGDYRCRRLAQDRPSQVDQPMTSALLVRRSALDAVGLFDEGFPLFFNDVDLCFRMKEMGWEIWYEPGLTVVHDGGASTRQIRPEAIRQSHRGLERFYEKHYRHRLPPPVFLLIRGLIRMAGALRERLAEGRQHARI